jgi:hypothetical protein
MTRVVIHNADGFRDPASPREVQLAWAQRQLDNVRAQINALTSRADAYEQALAGGNLGPQDRRRVEQEVAEIRRNIQSMRFVEQAAIADVERWNR